jgi:hypothetical protein
MELNITDFFNNIRAADYSASIAELGDNAAAITWGNAIRETSQWPDLLDTDEKREEYREHIRGFGAWDEVDGARGRFLGCGPMHWLGLLDLRNMTTSLALLPFAPIGVWVGVRIAHRIDPVLFYRLVYLGMFLTGIKLVWDSWPLT